MKPHILFVDDDFQMISMTKEYLEAKAFEVSLFHNAQDGITAFKQNDFDLCLLDVKMPFQDGFSLAREIRTLNQDIPIVFLTGKTETSDRIKGLTIGADDYVTKPFSMEELALRMNAILKRTLIDEENNNPEILIGDYVFNPISRELKKDLEIVKLSGIEANLLQLLGENINGLVKRDYALHKIWMDEDHLKGRSLNVYISKLRRYLDKDERIEILNVHGEGYRLVVKV